jgi:hypothetical protein
MPFRSIAAGLAVALGLSVCADVAQAQGWGTVKGQITLPAGAAAPAPKKLDVNKDTEHCLKNGPILSEEWLVDANTKGVKNVFVWLAPAQAGAQMPVNPALQAIPESQKNVEMDQPCCAFVPHCLALRQGQVLTVKNSSPVAHNVRWTSKNNPGASVIVPAGQHHVINNLVADTSPIGVNCDIHPWMKAWVRVFDHPYFALTDANGNFEIKGAPAGTYQLVVWHEGAGWGDGGKKGTPITIKPDAVTQVKGNVKP